MDAREAVIEALSRDERTLTEIAEAADMRLDGLSRYLHQHHTMRLDRFERLCAVLGLGLYRHEDAPRGRCAHCDQEMAPRTGKPWAWTQRNKIRKYCSASCRQAAWWARQPIEKRRKLNERWKANETIDELDDLPFTGIAFYGDDYPAVG